ncbi:MULTISPECIES: hypothetical protein [unclassified Bacillus cereus group]|uniref:hypothetical protein n=1 Tax=unclassified Bacillus cereus group TaxID=2750818 RepID=UPI001F592BD8|nr:MULTISPECIES: hypothetical protein [unclassified Bacillus cereus group]
MGFAIAALLFIILIGMIVKTVRSNSKKVNLHKTGNGDNSSTHTSSPLVLFAGSDSGTSHDSGSSHDCGNSFGGDGCCGGGGDC